MKVQSIIIGEFQRSPVTSFCLYQFHTPLPSPPRASANENNEYERKVSYFCLDDLFSLFDLQSSHQDFTNSYKFYPNTFFKDQAGRIYTQTVVLADIALKNTNYTLADLCRLSEKDLFDGGAVPLLKMTTNLRLFSSPGIAPVELIPRRLEGNEWILQKIKHESSSPESTHLLTPNHSTSPQRRLSSDILSNSNSSLPFEQSLAMNQSEVVIKLPELKPSSLLLKRLAPKHSHKNLTIWTPSYSDESAAAIRSAPLRSLHSNYRENPSKIVKKSRSGHLQTKLNISSKSMTAHAAGTDVPKSSVETRFPSPPIVPSQQPAWKQYRQQLRAGIKTATTPNFPRTPTTTTSTLVPKQNLTQKQKFLQPFEYLYDHIEHTRSLKTTLDDQVRRSATLIQNLQSSNTIIESMMRPQVQEMVDQHFDACLRECTKRIESLEYRSPGLEAPVKQPPITKESINDVLTQLMNRLEQIESKLDKSQNGA